MKQWLATHPEIEVVSRDRGGTYAEGAAQGAPQAIQIADRWHICKNLGDAVQEYLVRQQIQIPPSPLPTTTMQEVTTACAPPPQPDPRSCHYASQKKTERKQKVVDQVRHMHEQGESILTIAAQLKLARNTVRKYVRLEGPI